jgi:hypothetical protein
VHSSPKRRGAHFLKRYTGMSNKQIGELSKDLTYSGQGISEIFAAGGEGQNLQGKNRRYCQSFVLGQDLTPISYAHWATLPALEA